MRAFIAKQVIGPEDHFNVSACEIPSDVSKASAATPSCTVDQEYV